MESEFDLERFTGAQECSPSYDSALAELRAGKKTSHWIWYVFPQLAGLGSSAMSQRYAIASLEEARAYLRHPVLGARLKECADALLGIEDRSAVDILGVVDAIKLRSSMTLFMRAAPSEASFREVLARYFGDSPDEKTLALLRS